VELGEVATGVKPGRESPEEITLFTSLGLVEDVATVALVYRKALVFTVEGVSEGVSTN
jgi:ornithine cyclodeaminase/alanine dehydrogenase-like protein (mu-crystallin family)